MTRESHLKQKKTKELLKSGYVECYYCNEPVKQKALRCPQCRKLFSGGKQLAVISVIIIFALSTTGYYLISNSHDASDEILPSIISALPSSSDIALSEDIQIVFDMPMNKSSVESAFSINPNVQGTFSWTENTLLFNPVQGFGYNTVYTVTIGTQACDVNGNNMGCGSYTFSFTTKSEPVDRRSIGTGDDEFWSRSVNHPSWVITAVQTKTLLILTHSTGCAPCDTMLSICGPLSTEYSSQIEYYDITSGTDEPEATDCFAAYDPEPPNYVPLTTVVTIGPNNTIIWHSWEGVIDEETLTSWLDDAISYHSDNR